MQPINYPTAPRGAERIRLTPSPMHSDADIGHLVSALLTMWREMALRRASEWGQMGELGAPGEFRTIRAGG